MARAYYIMYTLDTLLLVLTSSFESYCAPALMSAASPRTDVVRFMLLIDACGGVLVARERPRILFYEIKMAKKCCNETFFVSSWLSLNPMYI
jgi:hypothetical protein